VHLTPVLTPSRVYVQYSLYITETSEALYYLNKSLTSIKVQNLLFVSICRQDGENHLMLMYLYVPNVKYVACMDQISTKTPNPKCQLFLKIDQ
jgi:hypothetical protein